MAIRVTLECGHSAVLRSKPTPEGYTHDWEVFVRGVNNADIYHFVEKVVFQLHDTFPNPKRVIKSPPYIVKESGYAGFVIPIHIYLRNKDMPKKTHPIIIHYDLTLQNSGPAINILTKHSEIFSSPSDEFRKLLLKGGATLVHNSEGSSDKFESKLALPMTGKPKLSGTDAKKHRPTEPKPVTTFTDLFGIPIKTGKISPDSNKKLSSDKSLAKQNLITDRNEKSERNQKSKHAQQHKEMAKDKTSDERRDKKDKDKESHSKDKSKERYKRALSPNGKNQLSPKMKRTISPSPVRKPPPPASPKRSSSPKLKEKDPDKVKLDKEKVRESARNSEETKSERKKDKKRHKEDREKEKKDKHKEKERDKSKESKSSETKKALDKALDKQDKTRIEKGAEMKAIVKEEKKSPKAKEYEKVKEEKLTRTEKVNKIDKTEKKEIKNSDKEKQQKHKHKKKDKKEKRDGSKDREKKEKRDKSKSLLDKLSMNSTSTTSNSSSNSNNNNNSSNNNNNNSNNNNNTNNALSTLMAEVPGNDSDSHSEDDSFESKANVATMKKEPEEPVAAEPVRLDEEFVKKEKSERHKRDKQSKLSRSEDRENRKKKRKNELKLEEEQREMKKVRENSTSPALEPVSSSQSPVATESERIKEAYKDRESAQKALEREQEQVTPDSTNSALVDMESFESLGFSEDYVLQLKELQHKIMTLQDNNELQRVVQVIAETGQYEITTKTFDFDLCTLDRSTVQRLQKFFSGS